MESQNIASLNLDPSTYTLQTYLGLVKVLDISTSSQFDPETYKQADILLTQFSKTHQAWGIAIQVLTIDGLLDKEYFHAANVLKNKMMYDFANLRNQDYNISFQIRDNLLIILKKMTAQEKPPFLINCICTAIAILIMHINENWPDMIEQLIQDLSNTVEQATCLLMILKYMASDCDNDSIVIEDSLRSNYFKYLDEISGRVFEQIFNLWAQKINQQVINLESTDDYKLQKLKSKLVDAFYNWIKLKLPDEVITNLTTQFPDLIQFVFSELENKDENLENATNCVIELITLSRKDPAKFESIREAVIQKVGSLMSRVDQAIDERDENLGEQLTEIFVELGQTHINQIIETAAFTIPEILLKLMNIPEIRSRRQVSFWKQLFKGISKIENPEQKTAKLMQIEPILLKLLQQIVEQMKADDDMFEDFNYVSEFDEQFDDFNLQLIIHDFILIQGHVLLAQKQELKVSEWASIECIIACISDLAQTLTIDQVGTLNDIIQLIYQLPTDYVALRRAGANLFSALSKIMKEHGLNAQEDVKKFVDYVIQGFNNKYSTPSCSKAFQKLCVDNAKALAVFAPEIIQKSNFCSLTNLAIPYPAPDWSTKQQYLLIVDGVSALVEEIQDQSICEQCMQKVIQSFAIPLIEKIDNLKQQFKREGSPVKAQDINEGTIKYISDFMILIGDFLKGCKKLSERQVNPFEGLFSDLWTKFLEDNFNTFTHIDEIVEQNKNPIPGFIYAIEFSLVEYHQFRDYEQIFLESFNMITQRTSQLLINLTQFEQYPDIAFDYFGMCLRYLKLNKQIIFRSTHLDSLISIWISGIGIEHKDAIETHTEFIIVLLQTLHKDLTQVADLNNQQEILNAGIDPNEIIIWNYFLQNGISVVDKYINVILSAPSKQIINKFVDVVVEFCLRFPVEYKELWFTSAFTKIPGDVLTQEEKQRHIKKIMTLNPNYDTLIDNFDTIAKRARNTINRSN
ncbi:arm repeat-containing protein [Stylonychia lemnae]|uniref:Arm repeat-containing protein n=1 Tax=Stylonychia lemnae TaxID=5949 RepID=A0A077ZWS0_STYLE|nr:arm repeat-containing protein [Stylonychia lemnae]|eukprot:CDW74356.1 arm repeat-containing protein [Stylonychia lemnae]